MADRIPRRIVRDFQGDGIVVHWEPLFCIHSENCVRQLPRAFNPSERPWIKAENATAAELATVIARCPSGALSFTRTDGGPAEPVSDPATFQPQTDGPIHARGNLQVLDSEGNVLRRATRLALCRCGGSQSKPFCDNSHSVIGFRA